MTVRRLLHCVHMNLDEYTLPFKGALLTATQSAPEFNPDSSLKRQWIFMCTQDKPYGGPLILFHHQEEIFPRLWRGLGSAYPPVPTTAPPSTPRRTGGHNQTPQGHPPAIPDEPRGTNTRELCPPPATRHPLRVHTSLLELRH